MNTKAKILIVTTSLDRGGAEQASALQSKIFTNLGYEVFIVTILSGIAYDYCGTLINLGALKDKNDSRLGRIQRLAKFRSLLKLHDFKFIVDNRSRNQWYREIIINKLIYNNSVIYMMHSYNEQVGFTPFRWLNRHLYKNKVMVGVSQNVTTKFRAMYQLKHVHTISNGLDFQFIADKSNEAIKTPVEGPYILYYGRIHDYSKNLKLLIEAYAKSELIARKIKLLIAGDGPDELMIRSLVKKLGVNAHVVFKEFMSNPFPLVKDAYFTILTSRSEGFGLTLVESLFLGTPVLSVNCEAGPKVIVRHEINGLLVENHNSDALAEAMSRLVSDSSLYQLCQQNAIESVKQFSLENVSQAWEKLLLEIAE